MKTAPPKQAFRGPQRAAPSRVDGRHAQPARATQEKPVCQSPRPKYRSIDFASPLSFNSNIERSAALSVHQMMQCPGQQPCAIAGFVAGLYVAATAINGWDRRSQYDRSAQTAFAMAK
jgi:hypothetical protein